jgi:hypothetical protein
MPACSRVLILQQVSWMEGRTPDEIYIEIDRGCSRLGIMMAGVQTVRQKAFTSLRPLKKILNINLLFRVAICMLRTRLRLFELLSYFRTSYFGND